MLGLVVGVGGAGPVHQVQVNVVDAQILQGGGNTLLHTVVPGVVELGGDPDLLAGNTGVLDTGTDLGLVAVGKSSVNVTITLQQGVLDSHADLIGLGLPSSQANGRDLVTSVEGVSLPVKIVS